MKKWLRKILMFEAIHEAEAVHSQTVVRLKEVNDRIGEKTRLERLELADKAVDAFALAEKKRANSGP